MSSVSSSIHESLEDDGRRDDDSDGKESSQISVTLSELSSRSSEANVGEKINEECDPKQSFKADLRRELYKSGVIQSLQTQLRSYLVHRLHARGPDGWGARGRSEKGQEEVHALARHLISDYLNKQAFPYTLSVFHTECSSHSPSHVEWGVGDDVEIMGRLGLGEGGGGSWLGRLILAGRSNKGLGGGGGGQCAVAVQTDGERMYLGRIHERMAEVDKIFEMRLKRGDRGGRSDDGVGQGSGEVVRGDGGVGQGGVGQGDVGRDYGTSDDKMLSYQRHLEERSKAEIKLQVARFKEMEVNRIRLEEQGKAREEVKRMRDKMQRENEERMKEIVKREEENRVKMNEQREGMEVELYKQRQVMLDEVESMRDRERRAKDDRENEERRIRDWEDEVGRKEKDVKRRETEINVREQSVERVVEVEVKKFKGEYMNNMRDIERNIEMSQAKIEGEQVERAREKEGHKKMADELRDREREVVELKKELEELKKEVGKQRMVMEGQREKLRERVDYEALKEANMKLDVEGRMNRQKVSELQQELVRVKLDSEALLHEKSSRYDLIMMEEEERRRRRSGEDREKKGVTLVSQLNAERRQREMTQRRYEQQAEQLVNVQRKMAELEVEVSRKRREVERGSGEQLVESVRSLFKVVGEGRSEVETRDTGGADVSMDTTSSSDNSVTRLVRKSERRARDLECETRTPGTSSTMIPVATSRQPQVARRRDHDAHFTQQLFLQQTPLRLPQQFQPPLQVGNQQLQLNPHTSSHEQRPVQPALPPQGRPEALAAAYSAPPSHQPPSATSHQPPSTTSHQPPSTTSHQPPTTTSHQPPTTTSHQPPSTTSHHPPSTTSHHPPSTTSHQPPTTTSHHPPTTSSHQPPTPPSTTSHQPPTTTSHHPPSATSHQPPTTSSHQPPTATSLLLPQVARNDEPEKENGQFSRKQDITRIGEESGVTASTSQVVHGDGGRDGKNDMGTAEKANITKEVVETGEDAMTAYLQLLHRGNVRGEEEEGEEKGEEQEDSIPIEKPSSSSSSTSRSAAPLLLDDAEFW